MFGDPTVYVEHACCRDCHKCATLMFGKPPPDAGMFA